MTQLPAITTTITTATTTTTTAAASELRSNVAIYFNNRRNLGLESGAPIFFSVSIRRTTLA